MYTVKAIRMASVSDESYGDRIRAVLKDRRVSQAELARAAGVGRAYVNAVVAGRSPPSDKILEALREHLGVSADWINTGRGDPYVGPFTAPSAEDARAGLFHRPEGPPVASARLTAKHTRVSLLVDAVRQELEDMKLALPNEANSDLHALLDRALPADAGADERARVRGFLEALIWERRARKT